MENISFNEQKELEVMNALMDVRKAWDVLHQYSDDFVSKSMDSMGWYDFEDVVSDLHSFTKMCTIEAEHREEREERKRE